MKYLIDIENQFDNIVFLAKRNKLKLIKPILMNKRTLSVYNLVLSENLAQLIPVSKFRYSEIALTLLLHRSNRNVKKVVRRVILGSNFLECAAFESE